MKFERHANRWFDEGLVALRFAPVVEARGRVTHELLHVTTTLPDARRRVLTVPWRRANPFFQIAEPVWILQGSDAAEWICRYNSRLRAYLDPADPGRFHGAYGARLRAWKDRDQLRDVIRQLEEDPGSRRACAVLHDPERDNPDTTTNDRPCNIAAVYHLRDGALAAATFNRSNDYILGLTYTNLVQFTTIQEFLAAALGAGPGAYTHFSGSLHLYEDDPIAARLLANRAPRFDVYEHVSAMGMRPWRYPEEGWVTIALLYAGLPLPTDACPYWRAVGGMLTAWRELQEGTLVNAVAGLCSLPALDWAIAGLEFVHRWACRREWRDEFLKQLDAFAAGPVRDDAVHAYITHDDLRD